MLVSSSTGKNIGDLLNAKGITWGFFEGGFDLSITNPDGSTGCARSHTSLVTSSLPPPSGLLGGGRQGRPGPAE
jgi:hypothetical protein